MSKQDWVLDFEHEGVTKRAIFKQRDIGEVSRLTKKFFPEATVYTLSCNVPENLLDKCYVPSQVIMVAPDEIEFCAAAQSGMYHRVVCLSDKFVRHSNTRDITDALNAGLLHEC